MITDALHSLVCPYCGHRFKIHIINVHAGKEIVYGSICCVCDEFPIVGGIIYLQKEKAKKILYYIQKNDCTGALIAAIDEVAWIESRIPKTFGHRFLYHLLNPKRLRECSPSYLRRLWCIILRRKRTEYNFFFNRQQEMDWLLLFLPTGMVKDTSSPTIWVNIGAGIHNLYSAVIKIFPSVYFYSIEKNFLQAYLGVTLFPTKQTTWICSNGSMGVHFVKKSIDIVTFLDSLLFIPNQKQAIQSITHSGILRNHAMVFASAISEHMYFPIPETPEIYPVKRKSIESYFPSDVSFFDHEKLSVILQSGKNPIQKAIIDTTSAVYRYCVLWPKSITGKISTPYIPHTFKKQATRIWMQPNILWRNKIF